MLAYPRALWLLALLSLSASPAACHAQEAHGDAITVFIAKKIYTMDAGWPEATAVAVQHGKILDVGSLEEIRRYLGKRPATIDETFKDRVLLPGFVEPHGHPLIGATAITRPLLTYMPVPQAYGPDFPGVKSFSEAMNKLKEYVAAARDPHETVLSWGYDVVAMGKHLTKEDLDSVSKSQPILVWDAAEHSVYANTAAMKKAGLTRSDARVHGIGVGKDGELNGQFLGVDAVQYILPREMARFLEPKEAHKNMKFLADLGRKNGLTTTSELALGLVDLDLERHLFDSFFNDPQGTLRCVAVTDGATLTRTKKADAVTFVKGLEQSNTDRLIFHGVKFFSDDSFLGLAMQVQNPGYSDDRKGLWIVGPGRERFELWKPWWDAGFHIHVHTNGNAGNQATLDTLAALQRHKVRLDHRFTCEHFGISTPEQARQLKALGGLASMNPYYLYARSELQAPYVGAQRSYTAARFKTLLDAGVTVSMHSDTPVGVPRPLEWVWIAVNRFGLSGTVRGPAERVTPQQAFRMITIDAAYTLGVNDRLGSIEPGKFADFTVLEEDPFQVAPAKLRDVKIWGTVLGGRPLPASEIKP